MIPSFGLCDPLRRACLLVFRRTLPVFAPSRVTRDVASALEYMHSLDLVNNDVKPDNVLIFYSAEEQVCTKLCDFAFATGELTFSTILWRALWRLCSGDRMGYLRNYRNTL